MLPGTIHGPSPSEEFLTALVSASTARSPLPEQLTRFYNEAKHLSYRFEKKDPFLHPYEGLVSVFHPGLQQQQHTSQSVVWYIPMILILSHPWLLK
jgi:hypothetical protein